MEKDLLCSLKFLSVHSTNTYYNVCNILLGMESELLNEEGIASVLTTLCLVLGVKCIENNILFAMMGEAEHLKSSTTSWNRINNTVLVSY